MQGTITIAGSRDHGVHIEASLKCEDILDRSYIRELVSKLLNDNEEKEDDKDE